MKKKVIVRFFDGSHAEFDADNVVWDIQANDSKTFTLSHLLMVKKGNAIIAQFQASAVGGWWFEDTKSVQ